MANNAIERVKNLFDRSLIQNNFRGTYVECLVAELLSSGWEQTRDWAGWDFEHADGTRLEVKQCAQKQSWDQSNSVNPRARRFSIRKPVGYYERDIWVDADRRPAQIYVLAWHGECGIEADQREPDQWQFFVIPEHELPEQDTIGLGRIRKTYEPVEHTNLARAVEALRNEGKPT
ncbi:hypothetical protein AB3Y40_16360 [Yoonia sp. R2331]|uniref:hypothetical protein n=1 Tax=Yoonia sp. R2331 TaxID=3237238 RepID=UPI0034E600A3